MKYIFYTLVLIAALGLEDAWGAERWTKTDTERQMLFTVITAIDWGQTRDIAKVCRNNAGLHTDPNHDGRWVKEINPFLGECPSLQKVDTFIPASMLLHYVVARQLPQPYRKYWQYAWIGIETTAVINNHSIGMRPEWGDKAMTYTVHFNFKF